MAHVTFIHGIANKPRPEELLRILRNALADGPDPLPLGELGVTSSSVYWADLLYAEPLEDVSQFEARIEGREEDVELSASSGTELPETRGAEEARFVEALLAKTSMTSFAELVADETLERVPLPWALKKIFLKAYLRDVHHYLFDVEFGPPGRPAVFIQKAIRRRLVSALAAPHVSTPHVVVAHSMGTVIAYDCLKRVAECPPIDGLITLGSPLGIDEIQDRLRPEHTRHDGFPRATLAGAWVNVTDRLDPVCAFDPDIRNDFQAHGAPIIGHVDVVNEGAWRHSLTKYLRRPAVRAALRGMLQLPGQP